MADQDIMAKTRARFVAEFGRPEDERKRREPTPAERADRIAYLAQEMADACRCLARDLGATDGDDDDA